MHQAIFRIETTHACIIYEAVIPEVDGDGLMRSGAACTLCGDDMLEIILHASDLPALRAALNTWLRLIQVASEMIDRTQI